MKKIRLYNVIFPLWLLIMFPIPALYTLLCVLGNALIDGAVLHFGMKHCHLSLSKKDFFKTWLKVFAAGWTSDFIAAAVLLGVSIFLPHEMAYAIQYNVFTNPVGFVIVLLATVFAAVLIYILNLKLSFRKLDWPLSDKKKMARILAVFTAPYLFFLPTTWFY